MRQSVPVVITADLNAQSLVIFTNVDNDAALLFQPGAGSTNQTADYEIARLQLPSAQNVAAAISFLAPTGETTIDGFTRNGDGDQVAVFDSDGSIRDLGAFRIADSRGNYFEIRIAPKSTARVETLKWVDLGGGADFHAAGKTAAGKPIWKWIY